jgi:hypothetical protein
MHLGPAVFRAGALGAYEVRIDKMLSMRREQPR